LLKVDSERAEVIKTFSGKSATGSQLYHNIVDLFQYDDDNAAVTTDCVNILNKKINKIRRLFHYRGLQRDTAVCSEQVLTELYGPVEWFYAALI